MLADLRQAIELAEERAGRCDGPRRGDITEVALELRQWSTKQSLLPVACCGWASLGQADQPLGHAPGQILEASRRESPDQRLAIDRALGQRPAAGAAPASEKPRHTVKTG